jgi:hypothetical protein
MGAIVTRFTAAADAVPDNKLSCKLLINAFLREFKGNSSTYADLLSSATSQPSSAAPPVLPVQTTPAVGMTQGGANSNQIATVQGNFIIQQLPATHSSVREANAARAQVPSAGG